MVQINYTQNGQVLFKTTTFLGYKFIHIIFIKLELYLFSYIGSLTGIKPGVFSVSINERNALRGGYIGLIEWIYNINRNQSFITFAIRDILMKSESYDQSVKYLSTVPLLAPCYYILAGPKSGQVRHYISLLLNLYFVSRVLLSLAHVMVPMISNHWEKIINGF